MARHLMRFTFKNRRPFFGWYIVFGSILQNSLSSAAYFQGFQAFFLPILNHFGWSRTAISGAFSLRQVESGLLTPFIGIAGDRWGARHLIVWGGVLTGVGLIGISQSQNLAMFYTFFLLTSIGTSGTSHSLSWAMLLSRWFVRARGRAMGIATIGPLVGGLFIVVNTAAVDYAGWRSVLFAYGVVTIFVSLLLGKLARPSPEAYGLSPDGVIDNTVEGKSSTDLERLERERNDTVLDLRQIFKTKDFWIVTAFVACSFIGTSAMGAHQVAYFVAEGFSVSSAAMTVLVASVFSGVGRIGAGTLVDYVDYRWVLCGIATLLSVSLFYLALAPMHSFLYAFPFTVMYGLGWGSSVPMRPIVGSMIFGTKSIGTIVGLMHLGSLAGGIMGPLILGLAFDLQGGYGTGIWILGIVTITLIPILPFLKRPSDLPLRQPYVTNVF